MPSSTPYDCGDRARTSSRRRSPLCTSKGADTGVTDWPQIAHVYGVLAGMDPSPVVALNHAAAVGFAAGPELGPEMLAPLLGQRALDRYQPLHATHADLLRRTGDAAGAAEAYRRAIALTTNEVERAELRRMLHGL
ncbi:hypothetical protein OHB06_47935 [Streptomyces sp. NBC_01604]|uniref:hypothetical protein n=1 Tax=Streptomyces sp. NBC_01604 TaxID=2975894 RepID=UPI003864DEE2